jgi:hypothetical protein
VAQALRHQSKFQWLTRIGFAARGVLYILIAMLAIGTGRTEDLTGALEYVGHGIGRLLLIVIAAGLATYGLWRLSDAAFGTENRRRDWKSLRKRVAATGIGAVYLYLAYKATRILLEGHAESTGTQQQADTVLDLPGGEWVLGGVAAFLACAAFVQFKKAFTCSYLEPLDADAMSPATKWLGRLGYAARGVIFLCIAWLIGRAALDHNSAEAGNLEQALDLLAGPFLYAVATGLLLFGAFSLVEARYRRISQPPPPREIKRKVEQAAAQ